MKRIGGVAALLVLLAACSSSSEKSGRGDTVSGAITVAAASSLTEAFTTLKANFEKAHPGARITLDFGASSELVTQIQQGKPTDVFASASTKNMTSLGASAVEPKDFVKNTLEIAVPPADPGHVARLSDLARPGVKVAVCDAAVPCGVVAHQVFTNARITVKPAASLADVKSTLAAVESGEVDAGLVYVTDVRAAGSQVKGIAIPPGVNASTTYPIARLKSARNAPLAKAWVDYVLSSAGRSVLKADGFLLP